MKIARFALFAAITPAAAQFQLRATTSQAVDSAEVRFVVQGLDHEVDFQDLEIIEQTTIAAYNSLYGHAGYKLASFDAQLSAAVPHMDSWLQECRLCPPDDYSAALEQSHGHSQLFLGTIRYGRNVDAAHHLNFVDTHTKFENKLCTGLRQSGSANLVNARDCSFAFLDMPGQEVDNLPLQTVAEAKLDRKIESQVMFRGLLHDLTKQDRAILDDSLVDAYNEAFSKAGYKLSSVQAVMNANLSPITDESGASYVDFKKKKWLPTSTSGECRYCPPDDDAMALENMATIVTVRSAPTGWLSECRLCSHASEDITMEVKTLSASDLTFLHTAFERALCAKLQRSGSANFANIHDCSFRFVHDPMSFVIVDTTAK